VTHIVRRFGALLTVLITAGGLAGCSGGAEEPSGLAVSAAERIVKIGVIAPLTGTLSSTGLGLRNAVDLAVNQANAARRLDGYQLVLVAEDDAARPEQGAAAANRLASDPDIVGVVGTYNSSVAQQVAPILERAGIALISPGNSNPMLTRGDDRMMPRRVWDNYFRVCATDDEQGPFLADFVYHRAGLRSVVTVHDTKTYGKGLVDAFEARFEANGGQVLDRQTIAAGDRLFGGLVADVVAANPDFVFYGGEQPEASPLSAQLGEAGFTGPLVGGDGITSREYPTGGGRSGDLGAGFGAPTERLRGAEAFTDAYGEARYKDGYEAYGALAYDAANILIDAVAQALAGSVDVEGARPAVIDALQATRDFPGITGLTTFDEYGDTSNTVITVYRVGDQAWKDEYTANYAP
jgi:branched-chain amino acid transport system substrate-binding protein